MSIFPGHPKTIATLAYWGNDWIYGPISRYVGLVGWANINQHFTYGYGSIPMKIPFLGGWTSINPSYFDVHHQHFTSISLPKTRNFRGPRVQHFRDAHSEVGMSWWTLLPWHWINSVRAMPRLGPRRWKRPRQRLGSQSIQLVAVSMGKIHRRKLMWSKDGFMEL